MAGLKNPNEYYSDANRSLSEVFRGVSADQKMFQAFEKDFQEANKDTESLQAYKEKIVAARQKETKEGGEAKAGRESVVSALNKMEEKIQWEINFLNEQKEGRKELAKQIDPSDSAEKIWQDVKKTAGVRETKAEKIEAGTQKATKKDFELSKKEAGEKEARRIRQNTIGDKIGESLKKGESLEHTVARGETLGAIARGFAKAEESDFKFSWGAAVEYRFDADGKRQFVEAKLANSDYLAVGQKVRVEGSKLVIELTDAKQLEKAKGLKEASNIKETTLETPEVKAAKEKLQQLFDELSDLTGLSYGELKEKIAEYEKDIDFYVVACEKASLFPEGDLLVAPEVATDKLAKLDEFAKEIEKRRVGVSRMVEALENLEKSKKTPNPIPNPLDLEEAVLGDRDNLPAKPAKILSILQSSAQEVIDSIKEPSEEVKQDLIKKIELGERVLKDNLNKILDVADLSLRKKLIKTPSIQGYVTQLEYLYSACVNSQGFEDIGKKAIQLSGKMLEFQKNQNKKKNQSWFEGMMD